MTVRKGIVPTTDLLRLTPGRWSAWQMLPGYGSGPYFSPISIHEVVPLHTGRGVLRLRFLNVMYAEGVQDFTKDLRVLTHTPEYLLAELVEGEQLRRSAVVSDLTIEWLRRCTPASLTVHRARRTPSTSCADSSRTRTTITPPTPRIAHDTPRADGRLRTRKPRR